jgi:hypothetical protein
MVGSVRWRRSREAVTQASQCLRRTTPSLGAPPLLNQEGSSNYSSPPQMRRGGA